jgi:hypothetical protein
MNQMSKCGFNRIFRGKYILNIPLFRNCFSFYFYLVSDSIFNLIFSQYF